VRPFALPPKDSGLVNPRGNSAAIQSVSDFAFWQVCVSTRGKSSNSRVPCRGLPSTTNGHLHLHLHPRVQILWKTRANWVSPHAPDARCFWVNAGGGGRWFYRFRALIYGVSSRARTPLATARHPAPDSVFGLLQDSRVDEEYVLKLLPALPPGDSELYSHPSLDKFKHEFDALVSPRVRGQIEKLGIELIRYRDL
jgi:hypothetical protein